MHDYFVPNRDDFEIIEKIATSNDDTSLVMLNLNTYAPEAGYPNGALYTEWMHVLGMLIDQAGGKKLWQLPVFGQPIGSQELDEIIAVWWPSHSAFLSITDQPASEENFRLRSLCLKNAVLHRCPGDILSSP